MHITFWTYSLWAQIEPARSGVRESVQNLGWTVLYALVGGLLGIALVLIASMFLPSLINRMTPDIDEEKEIARGNTAVAEYFGRVVAAAILGISLVVAAAVFGGILAGLTNL